MSVPFTAREHGTPKWMESYPDAAAQEQRITEIIGKYKTRIFAWDVVNETVSAPGIAIAQPHHWARKAASNATLVVNDYTIFLDGFPSFYEMLKEGIQQGVPIDAIGIQGHEPRDMAFPLDRVWRILEHYGELKKEIHITEFCPTSNGSKITGGTWRGTWDEAQQAVYSRDFYRTCFAHPAVAAITWWDLSNTGAWRKDAGLLREDCTPKPAYTALKQLIHEEWSTDETGQTTQDGPFTFHGFHGEYRVHIKHGGQEKEMAIHLTKDGNNAFTLPFGGN